jgi:16S rRNA G966 N2-methylase RsmD
MQSLENNSNEDEDPSLSSKSSTMKKRVHRGFLVTGLPLDDTTFLVKAKHLKRYIAGIFGKKPDDDSIRIRFDRNFHRRIRNGAFCVIFATVRQAHEAWQQIQNTCSMAVSHDTRFFFRDDNNKNICNDPEMATYVLPSSSLPVRDTKSIPVTSLHISRSAGRFRDHFLPYIPYSIRSQFQLDGVAIYSMTELELSMRMAKLAMVLSRKMKKNNGETTSLSILDAFACCGGNTLGFLLNRDNTIASKLITAIELDTMRFQMLSHNIRLFDCETQSNNTIQLHHGCALAYLAEKLMVAHSIPSTTLSSKSSPAFDVIYLDPPWGGPQYRQQQQQQQDDDVDDVQKNDQSPLSDDSDESIDPENTAKSTSVEFPRFYVCKNTANALGLMNRGCVAEVDVFATVEGEEPLVKDKDDNYHKRIPVEMIDLVASLVFGKASSLCSVVMLRIPATDWCEKWLHTHLVLPSVADNLRSPKEWGKHARERVFPFLFQFGYTTRLLCFVQNSYFVPASGVATNRTLDDLVRDIMEFQTGPGYREHKPQYYDFEKQRWILLKRWKGSKEPPLPPAESLPSSSAVEAS